MQVTDLRSHILYLTAGVSQPTAASPRLLNACLHALEVSWAPSHGGELGSIAWMLVLVSPSTSQVCLGGTGWKGRSDFPLDELSAGMFLCAGGSLQPRVQDGAGPLGEQQPEELMVKTGPKGAAQHYNSACPKA